MASRRQYIHVIIVVACAYCSTGYACRTGPTPPAGSHTLPVPYQQEALPPYCVPATIVMWKSYYTGGSIYSSYQHDIWNYASVRGWTGADGVSPEHVAPLASAFLPFTVNRHIYQSWEKTRAVADQEKALDYGQRTIVQANFGVHAVIMIGASWQEISGARPAQNFVVFNDPEWPHYQYEQATLQYWMDSKGTACSGNCIVNYSALPKFIGYAEHDEFEAASGTYYGDPNPPALAAGERLYADQYIDSRDGRFRLIYQGDGNLVLYGPGGALWASDTFGASAGWAEMQGDGNLVVYDGSAVPVWASGTAGYYGAFLAIYSNGNVGVFAEPFYDVWTTGTGWW